MIGNGDRKSLFSDWVKNPPDSPDSSFTHHFFTKKTTPPKKLLKGEKQKVYQWKTFFNKKTGEKPRINKNGVAQWENFFSRGKFFSGKSLPFGGVTLDGKTDAAFSGK